MKVLNILFLEKIRVELNRRIIFALNVFFYENGFTYPVYALNERNENCMDLLVITSKNKSHFVYIKDFNRFLCNKTKNKNKKLFFKYYLQCCSSGRVLLQNIENCFKINGRQTVKLGRGFN